MNRVRPFDAINGAALLAFNEDSSLYCEGISEHIAQEYAIAFARRLLTEARGLPVTRPNIPPGLSQPNRKLIEARLLRMYRKHFSASHGPELT
jgi:hypothetical protein